MCKVATATSMTPLMMPHARIQHCRLVNSTGHFKDALDSVQLQIHSHELCGQLGCAGPQQTGTHQASLGRLQLLPPPCPPAPHPAGLCCHAPGSCCCCCHCWSHCSDREQLLLAWWHLPALLVSCRGKDLERGIPQHKVQVVNQRHKLVTRGRSFH